MSLKRIRLELRERRTFPTAVQYGYEFIAPLDAKGHLDSAWPKAKAACTVRRFWEKSPDEHGTHPASQRRLGIFLRAGRDDDEPIFRFDRHLFVTGEYVT